MALLGLLRQHADVLEADLQRYYRVDLCDLWRGLLSPRRLRVLIQHLPVDSPSARALAEVDGPLAYWSLTDALLGRATDELALLRWQWESAHLAKHQRPRKQPPSVLPELRKRPHGTDADVIPLVSPHRLGTFIHEDKEGP